MLTGGAGKGREDGFPPAREWQAGLHHYDARLVGKQTLPLGAASDHTEVDKNTSLLAAGRCHPEKDNLKVELRTGITERKPGFLLVQE